jgi:GNAT superfamily N-acetyltransferase
LTEPSVGRPILNGPFRHVSCPPKLVEIRASVRANRLPDPNRVTIADYVWHIACGPIHIWEENGVCAGLPASDPRGTIWGLFVDPAYAGCGLGQALLAAGCRSIADAGHRRAKLSTAAGTRAERFHLQNGWIAQGLTERGEIVLRRRYGPGAPVRAAATLSGIRCRCSDRSNFGKPLDCVLVVPANGGFPSG